MLAGYPRAALGRLNRDGTIDHSFVPGGIGNVQALALQMDGQLLIERSFVARRRIQSPSRLNNTSLPAELLSYSGAAVDWSRSGTLLKYGGLPSSTARIMGLPGPCSVRGCARPQAGSWRREQLAPGTIRARGYTVSGYRDGSAGIIEAGFGAPVIVTQPAACTNDAGTTALFSASAIGSAPATYRWRKDGVDLVDGGASRELLRRP